jgi:preprotein translocase subunit SecF
MALLGQKREFDFLGRRKLAAVLSAVLLVVSIGSLATRGLNFGIDFTGGVLLEVAYEQAADLPRMRDTLASGGFGDAQVQNFGTARDVLIRVLPREGIESGKVGEQILDLLERDDRSVELRRVEFVGPQVGEELTERGGLAMIFALLMILVYIIIRFQWKFAVGSVAALVHDVLITIGVFSVLQLPFDLSVLAAILAVIGYSLNDTIVVFDRIRENFRRVRKEGPEAIMNTSVNQMLGRTVITSMTTLLVLLALLFLGGEAVRGFSLALIVGVVVGTYSSIYIASATALALDVTPQDLLPPKVEDDEVESMP